MRETPMAEFLVDREHELVPGTENPNAGPGEDVGQIRRGLIDDYWGSPLGAVGGFTVHDSAGKAVMVGEYTRPELREPLFRALRDLLDAVDPPPKTAQ